MRLCGAQEVWKWNEKREFWGKGVKRVMWREDGRDRWGRRAVVRGRTLRRRRGPAEDHVLQIAIWKKPAWGWGWFRVAPDCTRPEMCSGIITHKHQQGHVPMHAKRTHTHTNVIGWVTGSICSSLWCIDPWLICFLPLKISVQSPARHLRPKITS